MQSPLALLCQTLRPYRLLPPSLEALPWIPKYEIINALAHHFRYQSYLEIGVRDPREHFFRISIPNRTGVDPAKHPYTTEDIHNVTSDTFFEKLSADTLYDLILIDGLHTGDQVYKDIRNSLKHLKPKGTIILHDLNPPSEEMQSETPTGGAWNGSSWKGFVKYRSEAEQSNIPLDFYTIDTDHGVGIIHRGKAQSKLPAHNYSWGVNDFHYSWLEKNRIEALNLKSIREFSRDYLKWRSR